MSKLVEFSTQKRFQIGACVVSARKAIHLDVTTIFTYSYANTPLGLSERAYYLSYFIKRVISVLVCVCVCGWRRLISGSLRSTVGRNMHISMQTNIGTISRYKKLWISCTRLRNRSPIPKARWSIKILAKCMFALNFCQWQIFWLRSY